MPKILIADDNRQIISILSEYAKKEGYTVVTACDGHDALRLFNSEKPDIVLLDVMMPVKDGFEVCRELRKTTNIPIIMITARSEDFDKIMGLDIGADDYITKPFSPGEVMARVRAVLRRLATANDKASNVFEFDTLTVSLDNYTVCINNQPVSLTKKEVEILWTLAKNRNKVFSRDNLLESIWGYDYLGDNRTVDSHIKRLRAKLSGYEHSSWDVKTIWGVGYKFEVLAHDEK